MSENLHKSVFAPRKIGQIFSNRKFPGQQYAPISWPTIRISLRKIPMDIHLRRHPHPICTSDEPLAQPSLRYNTFLLFVPSSSQIPFPYRISERFQPQLLLRCEGLLLLSRHLHADLACFDLVRVLSPLREKHLELFLRCRIWRVTK